MRDWAERISIGRSFGQSMDRARAAPWARLGRHGEVDWCRLAPGGATHARTTLGLDRLLSPAEQEVLGRWSIPERRDAWLSGRLAAKCLVRRVLARVEPGAPRRPLRTIEILADDAGIPRLILGGAPSRIPPPISIAHDGPHAVAALARDPGARGVGIDIERWRPLSLALLWPVLTPGERARLRHAADGCRPVPLVVIWGLKEAVLKAAGTHMSLRDIEIEWNGEGNVAVQLGAAEGAGTSIAAGWRRCGGHVMAWAVRRAAR